MTGKYGILTVILVIAAVVNRTVQIDARTVPTVETHGRSDPALSFAYEFRRLFAPTAARERFARPNGEVIGVAAVGNVVVKAGRAVLIGAKRFAYALDRESLESASAYEIFYIAFGELIEQFVPYVVVVVVRKLFYKFLIILERITFGEFLSTGQLIVRRYLFNHHVVAFGIFFGVYDISQNESVAARRVFAVLVARHVDVVVALITVIYFHRSARRGGGSRRNIRELILSRKILHAAVDRAIRIRIVARKTVFYGLARFRVLSIFDLFRRREQERAVRSIRHFRGMMRVVHELYIVVPVDYIATLAVVAVHIVRSEIVR